MVLDVDLKKAFNLDLNNCKTCEVTSKLARDICEEETNQLLNFSWIKMNEDYSHLARKIVGYE